MAENLEEKTVMAADGQSSVEAPVTPEGGAAKQSPTGADKKKKVDPKADTVSDGTTKVTKNAEVAVEGYKGKMKKEDDDYEDDEEDDLEESLDIAGLFEGLDLSEDFKSKAQLVFEAAVNEAATAKANAIAETLEEDLKEQFETSLNESLEEIVENLDSYLDYVVQEWMEENEVAIEAGIKVEMAESFMEGLKELFYEHNVDIDEETIDVVAELEEEIESLKETANKAINGNIALEEELQELRAERVFATMTEGLSQSQVERFRVLSEKLDHDDLDSYQDDLKTIKESFFKKSSETATVTEDLDEAAGELIVEETTPAKRSTDDTVNTYASFLSTLK
jgi:AcrR family transcriptional regulator